MSLVTTEQMLLSAQAGGYAVGAFNVENMEMAQAVVLAAEELKAPVIIQTTPSTVRYGSLELFFANVNALAGKSPVPVALHLDHGDSFELCARALRAGYTSIMIDGSKLPLEENIALTKRVVEMCAAAGIPVEGEIGQVGGKEDDTESDGAGYTIPSEALRFEQETGLASMAVGVGTAHGFYKTPPILNIPLIAELSGMLTVPLVLHGASGLTGDTIHKCIKNGISKVIVATELRAAFSDGVKEVLREKPDTFDPKVYGRAGREKVKEFVKSCIQICGCGGKA
jgi:tagatose 1,6-diphosphate aldolase GatY/KbaY